MARVYQDHRQFKRLGEKAPWSVQWIDPDGRKRSKRVGAKSLAEKLARRVEGQLAAGTYQGVLKSKWSTFRQEYEKNVAANTEGGSQVSLRIALNHFERIAGPRNLTDIKTSTIDRYVAQRRGERGVKRGSTVSPATINRELRHLRAVLRVAHEYQYIRQVPKIKMLREPEKIPRYVTPEHFTAMYQACDAVRRPGDLNFPASDWWRGLLVFNYMTGWRIGEPLSLRREDVDLVAGTALTRYDDNKGKRDDLIPLHPLVVEHLTRIQTFSPFIFPWKLSRRALYPEYQRIQRAAGIHLVCREPHEHTEACHFYGFHDLRYAFATENADTLSPTQLQKLMRHRNYQTTQRYINMASSLRDAVASIEVPRLTKLG